MSRAILAGGGSGSAYIPQKGVDYWTEEDVDSMENILRAKAANLGGFVPVSPAPLWDSGADINKTTVTVTDVTKNNDGSHKVTFNHEKEYFGDGGFEQSPVNESLVYNNSDVKKPNGWTGLFFGALGRSATVLPAYNGESHSGGAYLKVYGCWSSLCKTIKLAPYTKYTFSFWQKGQKGKGISNITIAAKATDGNVIYTANSDGTYIRNVNDSRYQVLYNKGEANLLNAGARLEEDDVWQKFELQFNTYDYEYVDIFFYFGVYSKATFYFDDFSITKALGDEFTASYSAEVEVPPEVAVDSVFYIERDNGRAFTRFEYASSYAIKELYKYAETLNKSAYEDLTKEIGDISSAIDDLHAYAQSLVGGDS